MDPKLMKSTQDSLGKIIKKPPLTDKLLSKPPFRFLHDIITSVIKTTGFMKGLYTDAEMNSENVKDKDSKMAFLQKAVDMVSLVLGMQLSVRPSKVVAGHEPEKTNEFLQSLATSISKKVNNDDYVQRVLHGDKGEKETKPKDGKKERKSRDNGEREEKRSRDNSSDKRKDREGKDKDERRERSRDKDRGREEKKKEENLDRHRDKDREKDRDREKDGNKEKDHDREKDRERSKDPVKDAEKDRDRHKDRDKDKEHKSRKHRKEEAQKENESPDLEAPMINGETGEITEPPMKRAERPTSAKGSRRRRDGTLIDSSDEEDMPGNQMKQETSGGGTLGEEDLPPQVAEARKLARPSSARPAAPRVKNKDAVTDEPAMRLGSGKPTNVILDNDQSDDDDNFMVEESAPPPLQIEREKTMLGVENDEEHGGLVKKILESKKEFEGGNQQTLPQKKTEIQRPTMSDAARRKEREMVQKEIDKLRGSIQTVTRSANPLGKIMDYVQEDLDAMQKELDVWKKENKEQTLALKREQSITDKAIEPLKAQLSEIDQAIIDQMDLIAAVKNNIISNDQKIEKMLRSISKS